MQAADAVGEDEMPGPDDALAAVMKSGELEKLYAKWFLSPIPPRGVNLDFPLSPELAALYKNPSDNAFE